MRKSHLLAWFAPGVKIFWKFDVCSSLTGICVGFVQAEGLEQFFSTSLLLEVSSSQPSLSRHVTFNFPAHFVMGSDRVSVTVVGTFTVRKNQIH